MDFAWQATGSEMWTCAVSVRVEVRCRLLVEERPGPGDARRWEWLVWFADDALGVRGGHAASAELAKAAAEEVIRARVDPSAPGQGPDAAP